MPTKLTQKTPSILLTLTLLILTTTIQTNADCISEPWHETCTGFKIQNETLTQYNTKLCDMMYMPGCTIRSICDDQHYAEMYPAYCTPFSMYKVLCLDMPGMGPCDSFKKMCMNHSSVVEQCDEKTVNVMSSGVLAKDIADICGSMNMDGCDQCNDQGSCKDNGLEVYGDLCMAMDMVQCADWKKMCMGVEKWPICSNPVNPVPSMLTYFHFGITEYFLFKELIPRELWQYWLANAVIFISCVLYECLKIFRASLEKAAQPKNCHYRQIQNSAEPEWEFRVSLVRSIFHMIEVTMGSLTMLLLMTYNVGICLSILLGRVVGAFIVGNRLEGVTTAECH